MEYGKLQGETAAAGHFTGATPPVLTSGFNVVSPPVRTGVGLFSVTLGDGIDVTDCAVIATSDTAGLSVAANPGGIDTDTVKNFTVSNAAGAPADGGVQFQIIRTLVGTG